jgi:hypothetical protein
MDESGAAYQLLIERVAEQFPEVAAQVRDEVARGRVVLGSQLSGAERELRETRMREAKVGKIAKADVVSVEYSDDEQLALLLGAIICLAETMLSSRQAVVALETRDQLTASLVFEEPDGSGHTEIALQQDIRSLRDAAAAVDRLLSPALEELGGVP